MLKIEQENVKAFLSDNTYDIVRHIATFIPQVIKNETDVLAFVRRILADTQAQGAFSKTFEHAGGKQGEDMRAFAMYLLEEAGRVGLWELEKEQHAHIDPDGNIETYHTEIPQIEVSWSRHSDDETFVCTIHYVEGDSEQIGTWKL